MGLNLEFAARAKYPLKINAKASSKYKVLSWLEGVDINRFFEMSKIRRSPACDRKTFPQNR
jgi:hypothetical protein